MLMLFAGLLAFASVALIIVYAGAVSNGRRELVRARLGGASGTMPRPGSQRVALRNMGSRIPLVDKLPLSEEARRRMASELEHAGQPLRVNEYLALRTVSAIVVAVVGGVIVLAFGFPSWTLVLGAFGGTIAGWMAPRWYVARRREQRMIAIESQLPDALTAVTKSLRAGTGLLQALGYAADETPAPLGPEIQGTLRDLQLGADPEVVFGRLSERVGSPDLDIAVTAILIQRTVGGNLSEILATVTNTIHERAKLQAEVRVLTSRQRLTGNLVALMPVLVASALILVSPKMGNQLIHTGAGHIALAIGLAFEALGLFLIRWLGRIEV